MTQVTLCNMLACMYKDAALAQLCEYTRNPRHTLSLRDTC